MTIRLWKLNSVGETSTLKKVSSKKAGLSAAGREKKKDFVWKCPFDSIFNLESEFRQKRLAELAVESTLKCNSWPCGYRWPLVILFLGWQNTEHRILVLDSKGAVRATSEDTWRCVRTAKLPIIVIHESSVVSVK